MGHTSERTTRIYIREDKAQSVARANDRVCHEFLSDLRRLTTSGAEVVSFSPRGVY